MGFFSSISQPLLGYPSARRDDSVIDNYHGVLISDPYRWLENPDSDETKEFVEKQGELTTTVLSTWCGDTRHKLKRKLTQIFDYPKYGIPFRAGTGKYFYLHNTGLQPQGVLYCVNEDGLGDGEEGEVLVDPNEVSQDGSVALRMWSVSEDAKFLAYGLTSKGSDWVTIRVKAVDDKRTLEPDTLSWVKFSGLSWTKDCKGFFYSRYPDPLTEYTLIVLC